MPIVGRPPVAGVAVHFFLGDEFGHAVLDGTAAVSRQRSALAVRDVVDMQILITNKRDVTAGR